MAAVWMGMALIMPCLWLWGLFIQVETQLPKCLNAGLPSVDKNGNCEQGTDVVDGCCVECNPCSPGTKRVSLSLGPGNVCLPECEQCEDGLTYRGEDDPEEQCLSCLNCTVRHRHTKHKCERHRQTVCGECYTRYKEPWDEHHTEGSVSYCKECGPDDLEQGCEIHKVGRNVPKCVNAGLPSVDSNGKCDHGKEVVEGCCMICDPCSPGTKKVSMSLGPGNVCLPQCDTCEDGLTYRAADDPEETCLFCLNCTVRHRHTKHKCELHRQTVCGECYKRYKEPWDEHHTEGSVSYCKECGPEDMEHGCEMHTVKGDVGNLRKDHLIIIVGVICVVVLQIVILMILAAKICPCAAYQSQGKYGSKCLHGSESGTSNQDKMADGMSKKDSPPIPESNSETLPLSTSQHCDSDGESEEENNLNL